MARMKEPPFTWREIGQLAPIACGMLFVSVLDWLEYLLIERGRVRVRAFMWGPVFDYLGPKWFFKLGLIDTTEAVRREVDPAVIAQGQWFSVRKPEARG
jgi:hypothetical protein